MMIDHTLMKRVQFKSLPILKLKKNKLINNISVLKAYSEVKINNLVKAQMAEVDEVKKENCSLQRSIKQIQELHKDTLAFKEDIKKEIQKIYKNNANDQATLRNDIESVSDDLFSIKESIDMFEESLMTKKVKYI